MSLNTGPKPTLAGPRFCGQCGSALQGGEAFCGQCGSPVAGPARRGTSFEQRCTILGHLWVQYREEAKSDETWSEFFTWADIGLPLAFMIDQEYVVPADNTSAHDVIDETWKVFCDTINIPADGTYTSIDEAFAASPNPPLAG